MSTYAGQLESVVLVATPALVILTSFLPWFFFSPDVAGAAPLAKCNARVPRTA